ncbi:MAG: GtrA family protein [Opitutaceae bacterium]|nr:GtrA family protein [Opitutaceae bacterium]
MFDSLLTDRETQLRLLRFLVVGGGAALVQIAVLRALKARLGETWAFSISWVVSTTTHYLANRFWALPSGRGDTVQQLGEYLVAVGLSYLINLGMFKLLRNRFQMSTTWAALWAIPPSTVVVFLLLNYRVFGR